MNVLDVDIKLFYSRSRSISEVLSNLSGHTSDDMCVVMQNKKTGNGICRGIRNLL
jgi:hypothetical protein